MKVIEPTEILIDGDGTVYEKPEVANPWIRWFARLFDYSLFFFCLDLIRSTIHPALPRFESFIPLEFFLWIPLEALFLWALKTTPGKWWFRTTLRQGPRERLDYLTALHRAFLVWVRGIGFGIPVINGLCMLVAYNRLQTFKMTTWDRDEHTQIHHYPLSRLRLGLGAGIAILGMLHYYW
jgi:hypothetical protein